MAVPRVALQLYTVREDLARDYVGTLRAVAALGYPAAQFAFGYGGMDAATLRSLLDDLGLAVAGNHITLERLESHLSEEIDFNLALGNRDIICPWLRPELRTESFYRSFPDILNRIGRTCHERGARFHYHNHEFEFVRLDDQYAMDYLLQRTDFRYVLFEPDVYWLKVAGIEPADYIRQYHGRCPYIHLKDMTGDRPPTYAEVGAGIINFGPIFAASEEGGAEWYVVEQDTCRGPAIESVRISLESLRRWGKL